MIKKINSTDAISKQALRVLISNDYAQEHSGNDVIQYNDTYSIGNGSFLNIVVCKPIEYELRNNRKTSFKTSSIPNRKHLGCFVFNGFLVLG